MKNFMRLFILCSIFCFRFASADTLQVSYNIAPPFIQEIEGETIGPSAWLWEQLSDKHRIEYVSASASLDSIVNGLKNGTIDVCISPLTITSERLKMFDFSIPYYIAYSTFMYEESSGFTQAKQFLSSFFSVTFFKALVALAALIFIFGVLAYLFERKGNPDEFGEGIKGLWNGFWWSAVTMTTVGYGDKSPKTVGGRVIALIWMFTAIIVISGFTASITSSLTVNQIGGSSSNMDDFKEQMIGTIANSATEEWLKSNFFNQRKTYPNIDELMSALENKEVDAIAYDRPILHEMLQTHEEGGYVLSEIDFQPQYYAIGLNKSIPDSIVKEISISLSDIMESSDWKMTLSEYDLLQH